MRNSLLFLLCAAFFLAGCAAVTSTVNTVARGLEQTTAATSESTGPAGSNYADARHFVATQFVLVRREAAAGGGEHTAALAQLMGEPDPAAFGRWMQRPYRGLFTDLATHSQLVTRIAALREPQKPPMEANNA
ncbi:MAG: DUF3015 domain-containing protein [Salinisphaera sp.]|nr:DUF3015 domain-containing protein [Salinisphaera sp.]